MSSLIIVTISTTVCYLDLFVVVAKLVGPLFALTMNLFFQSLVGLFEFTVPVIVVKYKLMLQSVQFMSTVIL